MSKFATRLKELRQSRGMSMQDLAKHIGMSKSSVNMYERGEREPGLETLEAIADLFNIDLDYLLGKNNVPNRALVSSNLPNIPLEIDPDRFAIQMYKQLDSDDKSEIRGEMKQMLKADKYFNNKIIDIGRAAAYGGEKLEIEITEEKAKRINELRDKLKDDEQ